MSKGKILFKLSGSISCYKSCQLISRLVQAGYELEIVASKSALEFVGAATFEGLTGRKIYSDTFESGSYMSHIRLDQWADLVLLCPATANTLNKMANGIGDDLLTALFLAHDFKKPYLLAPAMNTKMYSHPATQSSLEKLRSWGVQVLETGVGSLACGDFGSGRLLEPEQVLDKVTAAFAASANVNGSSPAERPLSLLITGGGTQEPIDGVRSITNFSSGKTSSALAEFFVSRGHRVTLLHAQSANTPLQGNSNLSKSSFVTYRDLASALENELAKNHFDGVIHSAAVSDYSVEQNEVPNKIETQDVLHLKLKANPKLVDRIRKQSKNPEVKVVAFKLTNTLAPKDREAAVEKLARHANSDWIVLNDLHELTRAKNSAPNSEQSAGLHPAVIFNAHPVKELARVSTQNELAAVLESLILTARIPNIEARKVEL